MTTYDVISKATGERVGFRYNNDTPVDLADYPFDAFDHVPEPDAASDVAAPSVFNGRRVLTKLEFRSLFPELVIKAIDRFEAQFESSPFLTDDQKDDIRTAFNDYHEANEVDLDDPRWTPGLMLYVSLGIMTADEVTKVLNG